MQVWAEVSHGMNRTPGCGLCLISFPLKLLLSSILTGLLTGDQMGWGGDAPCKRCVPRKVI